MNPRTLFILGLGLCWALMLTSMILYAIEISRALQ